MPAYNKEGILTDHSICKHLLTLVHLEIGETDIRVLKPTCFMNDFKRQNNSDSCFFFYSDMIFQRVTGEKFAENKQNLLPRQLQRIRRCVLCDS